MATCFDVAKYILEKKNELTAIKLQKLIYYSQAWSLVWDDQALFNERIEAWIGGPVIPDLYNVHKGKYNITANDIPSGDSNNLTANQKDTIEHVLQYYGDKSSQWLSDLAHLEDPWEKARENIPIDQPSNAVISQDDMKTYFKKKMEENEQQEN